MNDTEKQSLADRLLMMVTGNTDERSYIVGPTALSSPDPWLFEAFGAVATPAGVPVSEFSALNCSAVLACVRVIAEAIGSLPLQVMENIQPKGSRAAVEHPAYRLLFEKPNGDMTALMMRETMQHHVLLWGNAYAALAFDGGGQVSEIYPITPNRVRPGRAPDGTKIYKVWTPMGEQIIGDAFMLHIPGLSFNGLHGLSVIAHYRRSIGLSLAAEEYGSRHFGNGAVPNGVLTVPGQLSDTGFDHLRRSWNERHQGPQNAGKPAILEEGTKWEQSAMSPQDSQFLETRQFQLNDIARLFRVPPHMIGDLSQATNNNIEQQSLDFVVNTLRRWVIAWEQECKSKLIRAGDQQTYSVRFDMDDLLRGDMETRYAAYSTGRQWGWLSADDVLAKEGGNPLPDDQGKTYMIPVNMQLASAFAKGLPPTSGTGDANTPIKPGSIPQSDNRNLVPVMLDALERIGRREREAFKRAASKPGFAAFIEKYIAESWDYVLSAITPVCTAAGKDPRPIAERYIDAAKRTASTWGERDASTIDDMLRGWESHPRIVCDQLFAFPEQ